MTSTDEDNTEEKDEEEEHPHFGNMSHSFFPRVPRLFPRLFDRLVSKNNQQSKFPSQHHNGTVWPVHDLLANELLLWLLPTHMVTHLIKFGVIFIGLLLGFLWSLLQKDTNTLILSNALEDGKGSEYGWACWTFGISLVLWIYYSYHTTLYAIGKPWMDPRITSVNRMEMHVPLRLFTSTESARRAACLPEMVCRASADDPGPHTPNVYNLDSATEWKFQLLPTVEQALDFVYQQKDADSSANTKQWTSIPVPSNWMLFPNVPDIPIYTNQKYPFPCTPPIVPRDNPTGIYQRQIALPADWDTSFSSSDSSNTYSILLQGFESMAWVFWNGAFLGCAKDSRLPSEFQIPSEFCSDYNENSKFCTITIVVCRWSDGSYVEDQDHWWMAGLHRSVELVQRSVVADIMDYRVDATALGEINVKVQLRNSASGGSGSGSGSGIGRYIVSSEQDSSSTRTITARLYADEQLTAEGDWNMASQELWSESISITNVSNAVNKEYTSLVELQTILPNVKLWTAETPNLYTLVLEQSQSDGDDQAAVITQVESCRVGFRTIDIEKGVLRVNGKRIMVCGINRHEHDPDHGKVVSLERMKQDITVLKQNNFNSVRTSHYPTHSTFYKLTDFYGMYVCDEANIETHGMKPMGRLAHDWGWENTFVSRVRRTVQRDVNHASIIVWSLGNEAGRGRNFISARQCVLQLDATRPICYESGGSWSEGIGRTELTDVICSMYPDVSGTVRLAQRTDEDRPVILCEYSHSMNNSNGNLHLYWKEFWNPETPRLQGGYIWDMIDQGLRKKNAKGRDFFAYGGDFGDVINDRQFCINGMFSPEREPHPSVTEIKYLMQPVEIYETAPEAGRLQLRVSGDKVDPVSFRIENRYTFRDLSHLSWNWQLVCDRSKAPLLEGTGKGEKDLLSTLDLSAAVKKLREMEELKSSNFGCSYFLNIQGVVKAKQLWVESGHELVSKQFPVDFTFDDTTKPSYVPSSPIDQDLGPLSVWIPTDADSIQVSRGDAAPFVGIDKKTGGIHYLRWTDANIFHGRGIQPNFTRATTDNDRGGMELVLAFMKLGWTKPLFLLFEGMDNFSHNLRWEMRGLSHDAPPKVVCNDVSVTKEDPDLVIIEAKCSIVSVRKRILFEKTITYEIHRNGRIHVSYQIVPSGFLRSIPSLPRVGISMELDPDLYNIQYYGRGPLENYPDRKAGSHMGLWETTPLEMGYDYIVPSENGSRSDCEWIAFGSRSGGEGMLVVAEAGSSFSCSALLHSVDELHHSEHTCDLDARENGKHPIHLNIDHRLMGVGGDVSWFPCVYPEFLVKAQEYKYSLWLFPLPKSEDAPILARTV